MAAIDLGPLGPVKRTRVHDLPRPGNGLEVKLFPGDLHQHKVAICVEPSGHIGGRLEIVCSQFARISKNEVINTILWPDPLVDVFVTRENDIDSILLEQRLDKGAKVSIWSVELPI